MSDPTEPPTEDDSAGTNVAVREGITYAERDAGELKLDLFVPERDDPPLVVYVHGGGWVSQTRENIPAPERHAAAWDCAIASVSYRLAEIPADRDPEEFYDPSNPTPRGTFPDPFVDVKAAIRWLRANADAYGYDADQVAVWGASAGGHLALLAGTVEAVTDLEASAFPDADLDATVAPEESGAVQGVVNWYGLSDMTIGATDEEGVVPVLLGGPQSERGDAFEQASPLTYVSPDTPPVLSMHGREDDLVPVEHARVLFDAHDEAGVDAAYYELHDLNHVWAHGGLDEMESERVAMDLLAATPTPAQSLYETTHISEGGSIDPLIEGGPPAGPEAIRQFLDRTIR